MSERYASLSAAGETSDDACRCICQPRQPRKDHPHLPDLQSDSLDVLSTGMFIALRELHAFPYVKLSTRLIPVLTVKDKDLLLEMPNNSPSKLH